MDLVILGGTFDPIHFGHLRPAEEVRQALDFDRILLIPAGQPPHRHTPSATAAQRLEMARRAVAAHPHIEVSDMELVRSGPSYAVDTLRALRAQDPSGRLAYVIGMDSFLRFDTWHRWPEILDLVHLVVALRPGWPAAELPEVLRQTLRSRQSQRVEDILPQPCGRILFQTVTALDISATQIRGLIRRGQSPRFLLPDPVLDYIEQEGLYRDLEKATKEWTAPC